MLRGLVTALRTLTILPVSGREAASPSAALPWFPVVGLLLGTLLAATARLTGVVTGGEWPEVAALVVLAGGVVLTRALHADGLADWADALGVMGNRVRALEVMKDPRVGTFGVLALCIVSLAKWIAVARIVDVGGLAWIVAAYVCSRTMLVEMAVSLPYARAEGGTASAFVEGARPWQRVVAHGMGLALAVLVLGPTGAAAFAGAWAVCRVFAAACRRRFGGVTGDLLGACSELVETTILLAGGAVGGVTASLPCWGGVLR